MNAFWTKYRWGVITFAVIWAAVVACPYALSFTEDYYLHHAVVIPLFVRFLIEIGVFVNIFPLPIVVVAAITISLVYLMIEGTRRNSRTHV